MKQKQASRRQRIPAFGEWNHSYGGDWPVTQYLDSAVPPSPMPMPVKKWRSDSATLDDAKQYKVMVVGLGDHGEVKKQSRVADYTSYDKAVDQDLYKIPPHMLCHKPRKLTTRSVWLGCLGPSCVDA